MHVPQDSMWRKILKTFWFSGWTKQALGHFTLHCHCVMIDEDRARRQHKARTYMVPICRNWHGFRWPALFPKTYTWSSTNHTLLPCRCSAGRGSWPTYSTKNLFCSSERSEIVGTAVVDCIEGSIESFKITEGVFRFFLYFDAVVCIWQTLFNHRLTRFKKFISRFTNKLCN